MQSPLTALIFRAEHRQIFIQRLKVQLDYYRCSPAHSLHENIIAAAFPDTACCPIAVFISRFDFGYKSLQPGTY